MRLMSSASRRGEVGRDRVDRDVARRVGLVACATGGARRVGCREKHLHRRVREHDGADVTALHHSPAVGLDPVPLARDQHRTDAGVRGHRRHGAGHLGSTDGRGHVAAVEEDGAVDHDGGGIRHGFARTTVVQVDAARRRGERHRAVHRTGVEHLEAEARRRRRAPRVDLPEPDGPSMATTRGTVTRRRRPRWRDGRRTRGTRRRRRPSRSPTTRREAPARPRPRPWRCGGRRGPRSRLRPARPAPRPVMRRPSSSSSTVAPSWLSSATNVAMRLLSFTRSSSASPISVTPSANAAATASTGSSSTMASWLRIVVPRNAAWVTVEVRHGLAAAVRLRSDLNRPRPSRAARRGRRAVRGSRGRPRSRGANRARGWPRPRRRPPTTGRPGCRARTAPAHRRGRASVQRVDDLHRRAEEPEQPLGVITTGRGFDDLGDAVGLEPGEHERRLHLTARDGELVTYAVERAAADQQRRAVATVAPGDVGTHGPQRVEDARHRPGRKRRVADEHGPEGPTRAQRQRGTASWCPSCRSRRRRPVPARPRCRGRPRSPGRRRLRASLRRRPRSRRGCARRPARWRRWRARSHRRPWPQPRARRCETPLQPGTRTVPRNGEPPCTVSVARRRSRQRRAGAMVVAALGEGVFERRRAVGRDHEDEHTAGPLGGVRDLEVDDVDAELGRQPW